MHRAKHFSRHEIDLESLVKLQDLFGTDGELDQKAFVEAFGSILGDNLSDQQLTHLFMKIDANSDGSVDWDEFTNYMFLDNQDTEDSTRSTASDQPATAYLPSSLDLFEASNGGRHYHKEPVTTLCVVEKNHEKHSQQCQLLSASRDGVIRLWRPDSLTHQHTLHTGRPVTKSGAATERDWITGATFMSESNKLAVSSLDNGITIFDMSTEARKRSGPIQLRQAAPLCLDYYHDASKHKELLLCGDDVGSAHVFTLNERQWNLTEDNWYGARKSIFRKHHDHVTKVAYVPDLSCMVTSSLDATVNVIDLERKRLKRNFTQHKKAVYSFAWCSNAKVIASCGLERHLILWSPYSRRSVASLHGHSSSVRQVVCNQEHNQLISLSTDSVVKVWDIRNHKCIQTIALGGEEARAITAVTYVPKHKTLVTASTKLKAWPLKRTHHASVFVHHPQLPSTSPGLLSQSSRGALTPTLNALYSCHRSDTSHERPITAALYNASFHQVVSADEDANLSIWNVESGHIISRFNIGSRALAAKSKAFSGSIGSGNGMAVHGGGHNSNGTEGRDDGVGEGALGANGDSITAICFDEGGRRLITGSHDGKDLQYVLRKRLH